MSRRHGAVAKKLLAVALMAGQLSAGVDVAESMERYSPKSCKFSPVPSSLSSHAYTASTGEVHIHDVFGVPSSSKRHIMQLTTAVQSLLTLQIEVHRDTPTTLMVDAYRRGTVGKASGRVITGTTLIGAGGEDTKAFLHGLLGEKDLEIDIVFELASIEIAASQVDAGVAESRCWPVRLDLAAVPVSRAALHWATACPAENRLPPSLEAKASPGRQIVVLTEKSLVLEPTAGNTNSHFVYRFGDERPWTGFERALWSGTVEVPPKLHRFVRFFLRSSFNFASSPMQVVLELFDLKDAPDGTALAPKCAMGCMGGVPVFNGQFFDHAMPTGFRYKLWLLVANLGEWVAAIPERGRHCFEFDFEYSITYEEKLTPFEVGPAAWLCEFTRLPSRIVQTPRLQSNDQLTNKEQLVVGRSIWIRDRFGFPPEEATSMKHQIELEISEKCIFRATTHHSDGVDVFISLKRKGDDAQHACQVSKHPGPVPRQTIFCALQPGYYVLTFFADYPLGGIHPCSDFFAQVALRPAALADKAQTDKCIESASDLSALKVERSSVPTTTPRWKSIKVPIEFESLPATIQVWSQGITVSEEEAAQKLYLRLVIHSDYVSSDLRFQARYDGKYIANTHVTSHGYADMIGPLDAGTYSLEMYYITGTGDSVDTKLCSTSMVDLRMVSRSWYANNTDKWLCASTRVPPPDHLAPQPHEQVLLDSEYVVPESGYHTITIKIGEPCLVRVMTTSADAQFHLVLSSGPTAEATVAQGSSVIEAAIGKGTYTLVFVASVTSIGNAAECSTFTLNLLVQPRSSVPSCPWASGASSADDHLDSVFLDLIPKHVNKELDVRPPVTMWMNQGMGKTFDMNLDYDSGMTAAVRLDVQMHPPFLPLEVFLRKKRENNKLEAPISIAKWTESRLLLLHSELPKGQYVVEFRQPRKYTLQGGEGQIGDHCMHVTINAEIGVTSKQAVNKLRAELLELPDLFAVQPIPPSLNTVGWFSSSLLPVVGTQVYRFKDGFGKTTLTVDEKVIVRVVCEPADLSNAEIDAQLTAAGGGARIADSDQLGQLVAEVDAGTYELSFRPKGSAPFLVTVGIATESRMRQDFALQDSGRPCLKEFPNLADGLTLSQDGAGWSIGPTFVRLESTFLGTAGTLKLVPVTLARSSVLYIETGSALPLDLVRIALRVPEGLWVGEQRGLRNSLEIELPPGTYSVQISQPKPAGMTHIKRCLDFSVHISATPLDPAAAKTGGRGKPSSDNSAEKNELTAAEEAAIESAPCFAMGTVPLPLDFSDPQGGSQIMGGPVDKDGRLLVRTRVMLTDMHNGRKKVFLSTGARKLQMKIGVMLGGSARLSLASQLAVSVFSKAGNAEVDPVESWYQSEGWERVYVLDGDGFWITFIHTHRERSESACLHFGLEIEVHPVSDTPRMMECGSQVAEPEELFPSSFDLDQTPESTTVFKYKRGMTSLKQVQRGFLRKATFTLRASSWVAAEVGYNFFTSHAELDIVAPKSEYEPLVTGEFDYWHSPTEQLNTRLVLGRILPPGDYVLRVADDHYPDQLGGGSSACFPYSFEFRVVPEKVVPTVVSVHPHPSMPIVRGVDLVLTLRFSEPPAGKPEDVVQAISLGGIQATTGNSLKSMANQYASKTRTTAVQVSSAEDHHVWVIAWGSQVLSQMETATLAITKLRSNATNQVFQFSPVTYTIVAALKGAPWSGSAGAGAASAETASEGTGGDAGASTGEVRPQVGTISAPQGVSSPSSQDVSRDDSSSSPSQDFSRDDRSSSPVQDFSRSDRSNSPVQDFSGSGSSSTGARDDNRPVSWHPTVVDSDSDESSVSEGRRRRSPSRSPPPPTDDEDGNGDEPEKSIVPSGYHTIVLGCGGSLVVFVLLYFWPKLRKIGQPTGYGNVKSRFRDIDLRTSEEELGLVQAMDYDDDNML